VVVRRFTTRYFGLVVISAAVATIAMRVLSHSGDYPKFPLRQDYRLLGMEDLFFFLVLGALCAVLARMFVGALESVEARSGRLRVHDAVKPALGGALTGLFAVFIPQIMGSGSEPMADALNGRLGGQLLLAAGLAKILATALTVGSGGAGGVFFPCLFVGAMFGGAYGTLVHEWFPLVTSSPGAYALVGMAAVFAAGAHAPMTSIIILIEMTDNYHIVVPLMSATVLSTFISQRISPDSLYTAKLRLRGIEVHESSEINLMESLTVAEAMDEVVDCVSENTPVAELAERLRHDHERGYPVVNLDGDLTGIVTMRDVQEALLGGDPGDLRVGDICTRGVVVCRPDDSLGAALSQFGMHAFGRMPVINPDNPKRLAGMLKRTGILDAYLEARRNHEGMTAREDTLQFSRRDAEMVLEETQISSGSPLEGRAVRDAGIPEDAVLGAIRRGQETLTPRGSTVLQHGDALFFITTRSHAAAVSAWIKEST
jgi:CIC family chloride channel protein